MKLIVQFNAAPSVEDEIEILVLTENWSELTYALGTVFGDCGLESANLVEDSE